MCTSRVQPAEHATPGFLVDVMPEQKCLTIDGTQVLWKHCRKKQGNEDVVKFCFGKVLPESQWQTHRISHTIVNACTTKAALASAVRQLAADCLGATIRQSKVVDCGCCKTHQPVPLPASTIKANQLVPMPTVAAAADATEEGCKEDLSSSGHLPTPCELALPQLQAGTPLVDRTDDDMMPTRMREALERSTTARDYEEQEPSPALLEKVVSDGALE